MVDREVAKRWKDFEEPQLKIRETNGNFAGGVAIRHGFRTLLKYLVFVIAQN